MKFWFPKFQEWMSLEEYEYRKTLARHAKQGTHKAS